MKILLDSNIIIYATRPERSDLRKTMNDFLGEYCVSAITILEVLGYHLLTEQDKTELETFFSYVPTFLVDDNVKKGIHLRQSSKMSLGDSIIAATALNHNLELWTNNTSDFEYITGIKIFNPMI